MMAIYIGCAGWSIPSQYADRFPEAGSHLERYAARFNCVEINTSFYRPHLRKTYEKWAAATPSEFRFAVKMPRQITHESRLLDAETQVNSFHESITGLGDKLGLILIQLPPSLQYQPDVAKPFFSTVRNITEAQIACEPRHLTWFTPEATGLLEEFAISRVAADPACVPDAAVPGGFSQFVYWRMHGSPEIYYSNYERQQLEVLAHSLIADQSAHSSWCIFDNTALGWATANALDLQSPVGAGAVA
jgi:uncharacterized protein YecE (DUF72 family)